jgi:hypothetical protein
MLISPSNCTHDVGSKAPASAIWSSLPITARSCLDRGISNMGQSSHLAPDVSGNTIDAIHTENSPKSVV